MYIQGCKKNEPNNIVAGFVLVISNDWSYTVAVARG